MYIYICNKQEAEEDKRVAEAGGDAVDLKVASKSVRYVEDLRREAVPPTENMDKVKVSSLFHY